MDEPIKFNYTLTCEFLPEKQEFRVRAIESDRAFESLILCLTVDEVKKHLVDIARETLDRLEFVNVLDKDE